MDTNKKIALISLGCAKNRVNSEQMMYLLSLAGYTVTGETKGADAVIVNTCAFIESAKTEAIETILEQIYDKQAGRIGAIIVAGCLPERYKEDVLRQIPEIDAIVGVGGFEEIAHAADRLLKRPNTQSADLTDVIFNGRPGEIKSRITPISETERIISTSPVWAYLKIADGCDNNCAYCCIPSIRGRYKSRKIESIINEAEKLAGRGYRELILVAQDTTAYGSDIYGKRMLSELLSSLGKIDSLTWIRLLYMYPDGFDNRLVDEISNNDKIVKYLDVPIQHINSEILRKMRRRGTGDDIRGLFNTLNCHIKNAVFRTSIITGLPGEGDKEFSELCDFLKDVKLQRVGVFPYSPEEGTPAAKMTRPAKKTALRRAAIVEQIQSEIMNEYNKSRIGTLEKVLIESGGNGAYTGRSYAEAPEADGYIEIKSEKALQLHTFEDVMLTESKGGVMTGAVTARDERG